MKKAIGCLFAFTALVASGITFSGGLQQKQSKYIREGMLDETHYREAIYDTGVKPVKMQLADYNDYTQQPSGDNLYNTQKNYHLNSLNLGTTWNSYRGDGVTVAVIDTGINYSHNDFVYYNTSGTSISDLSADFEDPNATGTVTTKTVSSYGWSVMADENGHGTNVASTIASRINGSGCVGVAPNVNLMFLKCPNLMSSEVSAAARYAADHGADIISISLSLYSSSFTSPYSNKVVKWAANAASLYSSAINYAHNKGCIIFAAAGNDNTTYLSYPACNNYVIGVGALASQSRTTKANYSNTNPSGNTSSSNNNVDVTVCGSVYVAGKDSNTAYESTSGTSFSCPITAAAMALYCQAHPNWTASVAEQALYDTCDDIGSSGWDTTFGYGCVNISELVNASYNVSDVSLSSTSLSLYDNNDTAGLTATVVPNYASNKTINWTNSDSSVATISSGTSTSGNSITVTGIKAGTTTLTAQSAENNSAYATCTVTVENYTSSEFAIDSSTSLVVGDTHQIDVTWTNGTPTYDDLTYESSDTSVCTVSDTGLITGVAAGTSTITVTSLDDEQSMSVTVLSEAPGDYVLVTDAATLSSGDKFLFVNTSASKANGSLSGSYLAAVSVTISNNRISTLPSDVSPITLGGSSGAWTFNLNGSTNLCVSSDSFNTTGTSTYTIAISNNNATVKATNNNNAIQYNTGAPRFKPYSSSQSTIQIYKKESGSSGGTNYTVTFAANGGSGSMSNAITSGTSYTTPACTFTYSGYSFTKWALNSTSGTQYGANETITGISANITLYAIWVENSSGGDDYSDYYPSSLDSLTGDALLTQLRTLNLSKRTSEAGYSAMGISTSSNPRQSPFMYTDYDPSTVTYDNNGQPYGTKILSFYSGSSVTSWNKEHVWPASRLTGGRNGNIVDDDIYMPRPTINAENSDRGNSVFYEGMCHTSNGWDPVQAFEVVNPSIGTYNNIRGECARIIFYAMTVDSTLVLNEKTSNDGNNMGRLSDLLKWNLQNSVNDREIRRQSGGQYLQGNRNAFVDHPEYACKIWGNTNNATKAACGYIESLTLSQETASLQVGGQLTLTATASGGSGSVGWETSDSSVASLSTDEGNTVVITAESAGSATITASYGEVTATCTITVTSSGGSGEQTGNVYTKVTSNLSDWSGEYLVSYDSGSTANVWTGVDAANCYVTTTISNNKIEKPENAQSITIASMSGGYSVKVNGGANENKYIGGQSGSNTISFSNSSLLNTISYTSSSVDFTSNTSRLRFNDASGNNRFRYFKSSSYSTYKTIQLYKLDESSTPAPTLSSITLNTDNVTKSFSVGDAFNYNGLVVTAHYSDSSSSPIDSGYTVSPPDMSIAGPKTITVTYSGKEATYTINVNNVSVTGVSLNKNSTSLTVGSTETLTATIAPSNATNKNVTWTSSLTSIATVDNGTVTAVAVGTATITVTTVDGNRTATCTVTVTAAPTISYQLEADSTEIPYMNGTNHTASVGLKLYQYNNGVKGSQVSSGNANVDTSVLGSTSVSLTYQATTYTTNVKVTNHSASGNVGISTSGSTTQTTDTYTMSSSTGATGGISGSSLSADGTGFEGSDLSRGTQWSSKAGTVNITNIGTKNIKSIVVICSSNSGTSTITAKIGSTTFDSSKTIQKNNNQTITFSSNNGVSGSSITITTTAGNKSIWIKSIAVTYDVVIPGTTYPASPTEQAKAWATYFINETRTADTCLAEQDAQKLAGLQAKWADLAYEYTEMIGDSKDEFCTSSDTTIVTARNHYLFIVSKFGANSLGEDGAFVKNSSNAVLSSTKGNSLITVFGENNNTALVAIIAIISTSSIGLYIYLRKRKED